MTFPRALTLTLVILILSSQQAHSEEASSSVPDNWVAQGFEAALTDMQTDVPPAMVSIAKNFIPQVVDDVAPDRASEFINRLVARRASTEKLLDAYPFEYSLAVLAVKAPDYEVSSVIDKILQYLTKYPGKDQSYFLNDALATLGGRVPTSQAAKIVGKLLPRLANPQIAVRSAASAALGGLAKAERATVIDRVVPLLRDSNSNLRRAAARTLANMGNGDHSARAILGLVPLLSDPDLTVQLVAAEALATLDSKKIMLKQAGIGIEARLFYNPGKIHIVGVTANGPAAKAGVQAGDVIDQVDGEELGGFGDLAFPDGMAMLIGQANTKVRLTIGRKDKADPVEVVVVRDTNQVPSLVLRPRARAAINALLPLLDSHTANPDEVAGTFQFLAQSLPSDQVGRIFDKLAALLTDKRKNVREAALFAIAALADRDRADAAIDKLVPLLADSDQFLSSRAYVTIVALGKGDRADRVVKKKLLPFLAKQQNPNARRLTLYTLWRLAIRTRIDAVSEEVVAAALHSLEDPDRGVRHAAVSVISYLARDGHIREPARARRVIDRLTPLLSDKDAIMKEYAIEGLGSLGAGDPDASLMGKVLPLLDDSEFDVTSSAVGALATLGKDDHANAVINAVSPHLRDSNRNARWAAASILGQIGLGDRAEEVIKELLKLLSDRDSLVRSAAVRALGSVGKGPRAAAITDRLLPLLGDSDDFVRNQAAESLAIAPPERSAAVINRLLPVLLDNETTARAFVTIAHLGPGGASAALAAISLIHDRGISAVGPLRAAAHLATGADAKREQSETLLAWLGRPASLPIATVANNPVRAHEVLALLLKHWSTLAAKDSLRDEAESAVMAIVYAACHSPVAASKPADLLKRVPLTWARYLPATGAWQPCWTPAQKPTLVELLSRFKEKHSTHEQALATHLAYETYAPLQSYAVWSVVGWTLLWAGVLVAFPWSRTVQATFFWNVRAKQVLSLWFVPLLLLVFPVLRRRILKPFHDDLTGSAQPKTFSRLGYFSQTRGRSDGGAPMAVDKLLSGARGTVVVRGEAGLGKTSLLRWLAVTARRPVVFLHARECAEGVDVAIAHMIRQIQEAGFVRSMVHTRAMIIIIDGLNEVSADTREKVSSFSSDMSKGDIIIGTQPIEWRPPKGARIIDLLPLDRTEARDFLLSRPIAADTAQRRHGAAYAHAVDAFIGQALDEAPTEDDRRAAMLMLSNPFDLSLAADLLAQGTMPRATALIDAAFRLADEGSPAQPGYRAVSGQPFPLVGFGHHAIAMRLEDRNWFKEDEFPAETSCLLRWRLLVPRAIKSATGVTERIQFRHDRVWDFFIAAAFRADPDLWAVHLDDPRFRGAYLRIAETWEPAHATQVRNLLITAAAQSGDHTTSDEFIKRLEARFQTREDPDSGSLMD